MGALVRVVMVVGVWLWFHFFRNRCLHRHLWFGYMIFYAFGREGNTAPNPVDQQIVAGEPVVSQHHGARRIERSYVKVNRVT